MSAPETVSVRIRGLCKFFAEVRAVQDVDLDLCPGQIHGLLGENGAGKTTLMCMLAGLYRPDAGAMELDGEPVSFRSPRDAMAAGVGMVHQHFMLVPTLTVAENVLLGAARIPAVVSPRKLERQVQARAEALFASLTRLCDQGCAVVLISHKLDEVRRVAHRLTVMRKGRVVAGHREPAKLSASRLAADMVGREVSLTLEREEVSAGPTLLSVQDLSADDDRGLPALGDVDLDLRAGQVLGLAGGAGNGQVELMEVVAGLRPARAGRVLLNGQDLDGLSPRKRARLGLRYVPEDRQHTGTAPSLSVAENLLLRRYDQRPCRRGPWLRLSAMADFCRDKIELLQISTAGLDQSVRLLSGGNLQKVILAREVSDEAHLILAMHPTRGLDVWATTEVRRLLLAARARQAAVLVCSEDLEELFALCDRLAVMRGGEVVGLLERDAFDLNQVGRLMTGGQGIENKKQEIQNSKLEAGLRAAVARGSEEEPELEDHLE